MPQTTPPAARVCASSRASQHATLRASSAAPATRPSVMAAGESSGEPSSSVTVADGQHVRATPAPSSITAVTMSKRFIYTAASVGCARRHLRGGGRLIEIVVVVVLGDGDVRAQDDSRGESELKIHRLLGPECAVVIEGGDALGGRDEIRRTCL